jgi:UDPglucose--hexose-1-phosphate uridylyltransferase
MPELRKDPIVDRWVIIAKDRADRPQELGDRPLPRASAAACPFCEGHEDETTREIDAYRASGSPPNGPGWRVRAVPNKYPALVPGQPLEPSQHDLYRAFPASGVHEVIIESPRHLRSTTELSVEDLTDVLWMYRQRLLALRSQQGARYPLIFQNVGAAAGASIEHLHAQLTVLPIMPIEMSLALAGAEAFYRSHRQCVYCAILQHELAAEQRLVARSASAGDAGFAAFCPYAARSPFETWIVPLAHASHFETLTRAAAAELARIMKDVLARIESALDHPAYNYIIHTGSFDTSSQDHYHWHIEIIPRVTKSAGFEWGTGFFINPVPPEEAAAIMRSLHFAG